MPRAAAAAALDADAPGPIYLVADDRPVTRREYYAVAAGVLGAPEPRFEPPRPGSPEAARDATNKRVANHRMKAELGVVLRLSRHHDRPRRRARERHADA